MKRGRLAKACGLEDIEQLVIFDLVGRIAAGMRGGQGTQSLRDPFVRVRIGLCGRLARIQEAAEFRDRGRIVEMLRDDVVDLVEQQPDRRERMGLPGASFEYWPCAAVATNTSATIAARRVIASPIFKASSTSRPARPRVTRDSVKTQASPISDQRLQVMLRRLRAEAAQHHARDAGRSRREFGYHGAGRDAGGAVGRKRVDAGRDRREGEARKPVLRGQCQRVAIAGREQRILVAIAAAPDRADGMDHMPRLEAIAAR